MANQIKAAHDAFWTLVKTTFGVGDEWRNVGDDHKSPKATDPSGLTLYVAQNDDVTPEVMGVLCGPIYDLQASPVLTFAFAGKNKAERLTAAWAQVEALKAAVGADPTLGGAVSFAEVGLVSEIGGADWLAGGLEVNCEILFNAPTKSG